MHGVGMDDAARNARPTRGATPSASRGAEAKAAADMSADKDDVEVRWEDQQRINAFGRLNGRMHELEDDLKKVSSEHELLDDAANELILADDDEPVRCVGVICRIWMRDVACRATWRAAQHAAAADDCPFHALSHDHDHQTCADVAALLLPLLLHPVDVR